MKKMKLDKQTSKRFLSFVLAMSMPIGAATLGGCSKQVESEQTGVVETVDNDKVLVDNFKESIKASFPEMNDEMVENASLILLLNVLAPKDENEKISADIISKFKTKLDVDNMISDFNSFIDVVENTIITKGEFVSVSNLLPEELANDETILSKIESITSKIIELEKSNASKEEILEEFNKIYELFVEENEITFDELEFDVRDLSYPSRTVASLYARVSAYYSRNYISEDQKNRIDDRTNDQNSKAYIKTDLEILSNQMKEKSKIDVNAAFNKEYEETAKTLESKVNVESNVQKDLVNYLNIEYLDSDDIATKDKNSTLGEYEDSKIDNVILAIDAIEQYSINNQDDMIAFSNLLTDEYKATENGKTDAMALNFVQYNSIMLLNKVNEKSTFEEIYYNVYFQNLYKYFTKQDFTHTYLNEKGEKVEEKIMWQEVSDGVNLINSEVINYTLSKLPQVNNIDNYLDRSQTNLTESIQAIQNTIMGECEKVDSFQYIKK